jgi:imidazolonepropionase
MARLLITGLAQVATPAGRDAPLRGAALGSVEVIEDAFVLCAGDTIEAVGRMRDLPPIPGDVEELDARGLCAVPGLVDCHTHVAFGGDRVDEFSLRAAGAGYEELHAAGGGILSTVRATRALAEAALHARVARHAGWLLRHGTTTWEGKSGYGLDRETELASLRAVAAAGGRPTWLGAHAVPPEQPDADAYLDFALAEVLPDAARIAVAADVFLERGAFDAAQARRYLVACRAAGLELRLHGDQFTESGAIPLAIELGARSVDHLEATGPAGVRELAASDVVGVLLPASALFLGRPMPPGRALVDAGAAVALATDFNPGSSFTTSLPLVCSLAATQLKLAPAEALAAVTVNAAHVLGCADDRGRVAEGYRADLVLLDAPDWRYLAYHLAGDIVATVVKDGVVAVRR